MTGETNRELWPNQTTVRTAVLNHIERTNLFHWHRNLKSVFNNRVKQCGIPPATGPLPVPRDDQDGPADTRLVQEMYANVRKCYTFLRKC